MLTLFKSKKLLDDGTTQWLFDSFAWALENFDAHLFRQHTQLILPTDQFFPDQASVPDETANNLLQRLLSYSAMQNWPCRALPIANQSEIPPTPHIHIEQALRGSQAIISVNGGVIAVPYDINSLRKPEVLIAALAQSLALLLSRAIPTAPPGGEEFRGPATDLLAIFLGFGLFMTNNAFNIQRGCSSCSGPSVQMMGELTEEQMCYALAIFCQLKAIDNSEVLPHLKKTLHKLFKQARKEMQRSPNELIHLTTRLQPQVAHQ